MKTMHELSDYVKIITNNTLLKTKQIYICSFIWIQVQYFVKKNYIWGQCSRLLAQWGFLAIDCKIRCLPFLYMGLLIGGDSRKINFWYHL